VFLHACGSYAVEEPKLRGFALAAQSIAHGSVVDSTATDEDAEIPHEDSSWEDSFKKSAAQKRQEQRDRRRRETNPYRTPEEEERERERKREQSRSRGDRSVDPYDRNSGERDYGRNRDSRRSSRCDRTGRDCTSEERRARRARCNRTGRDCDDDPYYYYDDDIDDDDDDDDDDDYYDDDDYPDADAFNKPEKAASKLSPKSPKYPIEIEGNYIDVPEFLPDNAVIDFKKNAAQKRQDQRDRRRRDTNPDRSHREEERERERKRRQSRSRSRRDIDPYDEDEGDEDYGRDREARRRERCRRTGRDCDKVEAM